MSSETANEVTTEAPAPSSGLIDIDAIDYDVILGFLTVHGVKFLAALAIFFIGKWVIGRVVNVMKRGMGRANVDPTLTGFLGNILFGIGMALVVIAALSQMGIETTQLAAVIAAAGLAIGLALQGSLSNFAAGVLIILFRFFRKGDYVEIAGVGGTVEDISILTTQLTTPDNRHLVIPNSNITTNVITNYSTNPTRKIELVIGVAYDADLRKAEEIFKSLLEADPRILKEPAYQVAVLELADSSVNFAVRPWVKREDYWPVRLDLNREIKLALDDAGIGIPFPQRDVNVFVREGEFSAAPPAKAKAK